MRAPACMHQACSFAVHCRSAHVRRELLPDLRRRQHRQGGACAACHRIDARFGRSAYAGCALALLPFCQVVASLLVSAVLLGFKLSALKRLVQVNQRRTELQAALILLEPEVEAEKLAVWLADVTATSSTTRSNARTGSRRWIRLPAVCTTRRRRSCSPRAPACSRRSRPARPARSSLRTQQRSRTRRQSSTRRPTFCSGERRPWFGPRHRR
jgi:hypothetical protein